MLITEKLKKDAEIQPTKIHSIFEGRESTYKEFYEKSKRIAAYFQEKGYQKGDIIALYTINSDHFIASYYGILLGGFTVMPVNTKLAAREVEYIFSHSEAKALIYDVRTQDTLDRVSTKFKDTVTIGDNKGIEKIYKDDSLNYTPVNQTEDEVAGVFYTSGTTGKPKGVMLTHGNLKSTAEIWGESLEMTKDDLALVSTPLFHCAAIHILVVPITYLGGTLSIEEAFSPTGTLRSLEKSKATVFFGPPTMYSLILNLPEADKADLSNLRLFAYGAAPMPYELVKRLKKTFPDVSLRNLYGQTENSPACSSLQDDQALEKVGSVGTPLPYTEIRIVDEYGEEVAANEVGEVTMRGPQVMKGYLKNQEETDKALVNGWLYTGDLGTMDEDGLLYIVDRKKDMIIRGGENVYPVEVEEILYQMPEVLEAAIIGLPHEIYGEVPKGFIVLKEGQKLTEEQVISYCKENLAKFKIPYEVEFLDELPRNASGKVLKQTLRSD